ncbi:MAG: OmpH family outer membrane protein [Bacteroidetes bacterium]|nr:OmpH family outer membrane protein [Bacteroidota bacterium]
MKNRIFGLLLATLIAGITTGGATAQNLKVGYADPEVIITYMPEYNQVQSQMAIEYRTSQEALQAMAADFQDRVEKYQKQQPLLSAERQAEREAELVLLQSEIQGAATKKDEEFNLRQEELMAPLLEKVQQAIDAIAKEQGLDMVIRSPALLYVNSERVTNINIDIAKKLGIEIDDETTATK